MGSPFKNRIKSVQKILSAHKTPAAILLGSSPFRLKSRDQDYPYLPDSDFYYLTGISQPDFILLITNTTKSPLLYTKKIDPVKVLWDGAPPNVSKFAHDITAEFIVTKNIKSEVVENLSGIELLYFQNVEGSLAWEISKRLISTPSHLRGNYPQHFHHSDSILEKMRLYKDTEEIKLIKRASQFSYEALRTSIPLILKGTKESDIAASIEYNFRLSECDTAFNTIVATGKNAATLHHRASQDLLGKDELVLIDWGASYRGYASDITRVFPVSGKFSTQQRDLYEIVLAAQKSAIKKIRHGVSIKSIYDTAAKILINGLIDLKVLRGKASTLYAKNAHRAYFPHGIGHSVGLDIHDIGKLRGNNAATLEKGMVFTVEPGLYFRRKTGKLPACGIRIEDTLLVTQNGSEILTNATPKSVDQIEELMTF